MKSKEFFAACADAFSPLMTQFNLEVAGQHDRKDVWEWVLKNRTTGIRVIYELKDYYIGFQICRLENGRIKPYMGEMRPDSALSCFDLLDLLSMRIPNEEHAPIEEFKLSKYSLPEILSRASEYLYDLAGDVLQGNFGVFDSLDRIVKDRAREAAFKKWGDKAHEFGW